MLTPAEILTVLDYNPETGIFTWKIHQGTQAAGARAGHITPKGYRVIGIYGHVYHEHQLAWVIMTGKKAPQVDHKDRDKSNNKWANLRVADTSRNKANNTGYKRTQNLPKGVYHQRGSSVNKFVAMIRVHGKAFYLGVHPTAEAAHKAYQEAAKKHFGEFANW